MAIKLNVFVNYISHSEIPNEYIGFLRHISDDTISLDNVISIL